MEKLFNLLLLECSRIALKLSDLSISDEQISLFEEYAEINLIFNGFNLLYKYKGYLYELFIRFKEEFGEIELNNYSAKRLHQMLLNIKECELCYYRVELDNYKIWQHYHAYLPYDPSISDFQKKRIMCKVSEFLLVQKHFLQLLRIFLKSQLEIEPCTKAIHTSKINTIPKSDNNLVWHGNKCDLVELILGLYHSKTVVAQDRKLSLHAFQASVSTFFNVDLSEYSVIASNIYKRKRNYSVFFSKMNTFFNEFIAKH